MEYNLSIRQDNVEQYLDLQREISEKKNGLFTCIIRVNNGKICDLNMLEYVNARIKYLRLKEIVRTEFTILHSVNKGIGNDAVRSGDSQRNSE